MTVWLLSAVQGGDHAEGCFVYLPHRSRDRRVREPRRTRCPVPLADLLNVFDKQVLVYIDAL